MKYSETIRLGMLSRDEFLGLCHRSVVKLGWRIFELNKTGFSANFSQGYIGEPPELEVECDEVDAKISCSLYDSGMLSSRKSKECVDQILKMNGVLKHQMSPGEMLASWEGQLAARKQDIDGEAGVENDSGQAPAGKLAFINQLVPHRGFITTPVLIYLNLLVFIAMVASGVDFFAPDILDMLNWGANFKPLNQQGEAWRLFTACFLHYGVIHLLLNMYALFFIGNMLEPMLGSVRMALAYVAAGVFSSSVSMWWSTASVSAGASGAIFGMYGVFIAILLLSGMEQANRKPLLVSIATFVAYNVIFGLSEGIDNAAHIGGLAAGLLIGFSVIGPIRFLDSVRPRLPIFVLALMISSASAWLFFERSSKDLLLYSRGLEQFAQFEANAIQVLGIPEELPLEDRLRYIRDDGVGNWNRCLDILKGFKALDLPEEISSRNGLLEDYCKLRIEAYNLIYRNQILYSEDNVRSLEEINGKIESILGQLSEE